MNPEDPLEDLKLRAKVGADKLRQAWTLIKEALYVCKPITVAIENGDAQILLTTEECDDLIEAEEALFALMERFE